jgi:pimeloyl-ACP methyl ester carboxylesterase
MNTTTQVAQANPADQAPQAANSHDLARLTSRFLSPKRTEAKAWPSHARSFTVPVQTPAGWPDGPHLLLQGHQIGQGPAVLLVHGWQAQGADLMPLAQAVADAGFTVWSPDLPAHGHSAGTWLSIPLAAQAMLAVGHLAGPFHAAVAHSLGGAALVHALTQGLQTARAVLLAPPTHYGQHARHAAQLAGLSDVQTKAWLDHLTQTIGASPDGIDMRQQAPGLKLPATLMHSADDPVVPAQATQRVAQAWPGARWQLLQGLGHFRILTDPAVHEAVIQACHAPAPARTRP